MIDPEDEDCEDGDSEDEEGCETCDEKDVCEDYKRKHPEEPGDEARTD